MGKKKVFSFLGFVVLFLLVFPFSLTSEPSEVSAGPISCKGLGDTEIMDVNETSLVSDDFVTIQCGGVNLWISIRSAANYGGGNNQYHNYNTTGGYQRAKSNFDSLPGTVTKTSPMTKRTPDGHNVTLYQATGTTGRPWTVQYSPRPRTTNQIDKIRYYDSNATFPMYLPSEEY
ncbi:hypothetical protein [Bacillus suaedae]|uniref:Uncharacterized protein n=1 Tax=Halalkalibacter suaedae TaxID=2822140 RepID=A0A941API1_9BACI|nr:hypothetical protein [Bacillus suaedae]MBP3952810.1 hypothetical protein [Bacillus suaedae]